MTQHDEVLKLQVTGNNPRRNGKTTALVDIAIQNALQGRVVEYWAHNWPMADYAMRMLSLRYRGDAKPRREGMTVTFDPGPGRGPMGRITFTYGEGSNVRATRTGLPMYSYTDVLIEDLEGPTSNVSIRTGRKLPGIDPILR